MLAGITEILIISTPHDLPSFQRLLGNGDELGLSLEYKEQPSPDGLAQAFIIGEEFIGDDNVALILGDNIFYGQGLSRLLKNSISNVEDENKATIFGYYVKDPERYGVAGFNEDGEVTSIEEKPEVPQSNFAVVGLYFYPNKVIQMAKNLKPSPRGELEITDINKLFLDNKSLKVEAMGRGYAWLDTGTHESMLEASQFVQTIEARQGLKIACLEEIAYEQEYISREELLKLAEPLKKNQYGQYLIDRANKPRRLK